MASLDTLPADQRAVLQLVLQRERSYGEIAQQLSIDSASVRERAHVALDALGPSTRIPKERREEIGDYLLGQLPAGAAARARERIAQAPGERAWARVVASELAPIANGPLAEIPLEATGAAAPEPDVAAQQAQSGAQPAEPEAASTAAGAEQAPKPAEPEEVASPRKPVAAFAATAPEAPETPAAGEPTGAPPKRRPTSRRGGAILLALGGLVAIAVVAVVILLVANGGSSKKSTTTAAEATPRTAGSATTSTSATPAARPIAQVNLVSPTHSKKVAGIAEIIKQGSKEGLVIVAQGIPANTSHDAYAVWLYNSQSDNHILGFVNPGVKTDGKLQTAGPLPANAAHFRQLLVTLETQAKPHGPGKIVLQGPLSITQ
jgi:hypothetical protein